MPIFPDVDGVLFELLLVATPRDPVEGCAGLQSTDAIGDSGSTCGSACGRPIHLEVPGKVAKAANRRSERNARGVGGGEPSLGESEAEGKSAAATSDRLADDRTTVDPRGRSCTFVGAVALLLSEVVGAWREMESPLFDGAGGVAGTIKLAARVLDGDAGRAQQADKTAVVQERNRDKGGEEALETAAAHRATEPESVEAGVSAAHAKTEAVGPPLASSGLARSHVDDVSPADRMAKPRGGRRERRGASAPTSPCCDRSRGRCGDSRGPASVGPAEQRSSSSCTAAALEARQLEPVRADEMAPRAVIMYRGVRLPFRWFRSGTAKGMDEALREMLGELHVEQGVLVYGDLQLQRSAWAVCFAFEIE